ncbi:magnesium transporter [Marininema mesophilum]|uniref:Magnesium transporter n=1 Tax=Marininema mesophilum TaxID=1048340 RepID=A0A1H2ZLJ5_9BACL|nr:magnesium transporter CorA family protein [Marininema mesophilum]SDX18206.1 magnesium transporter [Marininema mesophilum]
MLTIYQSDTQGALQEVNQFKKGCWIHLTHPSDEEKQRLISELNIDLDFLNDALDEEETARIDKENGQVILFVEVPISQKEGDKEIYTTVPLGIMVTEDYFLTVCLKETDVMKDFVQGNVKNFYTHMTTRFVLQILFRTSNYFLQGLKRINKHRENLEISMRKSLKNNELLSVLAIQKSLVYFSTALEDNSLLVERLLSGSFLKMYDDDQELLEDVKIEMRQAIKTTEIYSTILGNVMNGFSSIISNNLNHKVKLLSALTIIVTLPMIIATYYGMNVKLPMQDHPQAFNIIMILSATITIGTALLFWKKKYL